MLVDAYFPRPALRGLRSPPAGGTIPAMKITAAISGGTDSLFALLSLREQGHEVTALHRASFGPLTIPDGMQIGEHIRLTEEQVDLLRKAVQNAAEA